MNRYSMYKVGFAGLLAGLPLAFFFKFIEVTTDHKVYTLLLNIDYISVLNTYHFSEFVEVSFHLIVSIVLSVFLFYFMRRKKIINSTNVILFCVMINVFIAALYYPTTTLSDRTPPLWSLTAIAYWVVGHVLYGLLQGYLLSIQLRRHK